MSDPLGDLVAVPECDLLGDLAGDPVGDTLPDPLTAPVRAPTRAPRRSHPWGLPVRPLPHLPRSRRGRPGLSPGAGVSLRASRWRRLPGRALSPAPAPAPTLPSPRPPRRCLPRRHLPACHCHSGEPPWRTAGHACPSQPPPPPWPPACLFLRCCCFCCWAPPPLCAAPSPAAPPVPQRPPGGRGARPGGGGARPGRRRGAAAPGEHLPRLGAGNGWPCSAPPSCSKGTRLTTRRWCTGRERTAA